MRGVLAGIAAVFLFLVPASPVSAQTTPTLTATPDAGLHDLQRVTVAGSDFAPGQSITLAQCALSGSGAVAGVCHGASTIGVTAGPTGAFSVTFIVRRTIQESGVTVDCAESAQRCGVSASALAVAPLTFDPAVPAITPQITVDPATGLAAGNIPIVRGSGFTPDKEVLVALCLTGQAALAGCDTSTRQPVQVDSNGNFIAQYTIVSQTITPPTQFGGPVDCGVPAGATPCSIVAASAQGASAEFSSVPVSFAAAPAPAPAPTELPRTGASTSGSLLALALGCIGLGCVLRARATRWR